MERGDPMKVGRVGGGGGMITIMVRAIDIIPHNHPRPPPHPRSMPITWRKKVTYRR